MGDGKMRQIRSGREAGEQGSYKVLQGMQIFWTADRLDT